jgi:hypothetical protein
MRGKLVLLLISTAVTGSVLAHEPHQESAAASVDAQNAALKKNTEGKGFGPQAPRDLNSRKGMNKRVFAPAPAYPQMNLCNIHFHKNAEHKGGQFTTPATGGDGHEAQAGYRYSGKLSATESKPLDAEVCHGEHGGLQAGDTIELHYVHSSAQVVPGPTLSSCLSESDSNPQLRVEAQVFVLVNDAKAADFAGFAQTGEKNGYQQALNIPKNSGMPVKYAGSTTGPAYNEKGSPLQVSWSVRPKVIKVSAQSVDQWCKGNIFKEDHPHGARNLVVDPKLLSEIK